MPVERLYRTLRLLHFSGTTWFIVCAGGVLVLRLRQAGVNWWVIFSLSGYSAVAVFLLVSLYLFAIFRVAVRSRKTEIEHPLTSSTYYMLFYYVSPFLGGLAGCLNVAGINRGSYRLLVVALGTFVTTFLVWIILDPAVGMVETLLPESRKHWIQRRVMDKAIRSRKRQQREHLLAEVQAQDEKNRRHWRTALAPDAERLAELVANGGMSSRLREEEAVKIGIKAWQVGGLRCMREVHQMATEICRLNQPDGVIINYICSWWDGIGSWRCPSIDERIT